MVISILRPLFHSFFYALNGTIEGGHKFLLPLLFTVANTFVYGLPVL